jgi:RimJ/RimL family protein N-acetyltransferase
MGAMTLDQLRTPRLLLSRPRPADLPDLVRMYADPAVMATLGGLRSAEESRVYLDRMMAHWQEHGFGWWVARDPASGRFLGRGGLRHVQVEAQDEVEVGYGFVAEAWGKGLATELALESVRVGLEVLGLRGLVSFTLPTNLASRRVMEKAGFVYERDFVHADLPHVLYRLRPEGGNGR